MINRYFNTAAVNFDPAPMKKSQIPEKASVQFRSEFFNAFDKPGFAAPYDNLSMSNRSGRIEKRGLAAHRAVWTEIELLGDGTAHGRFTRRAPRIENI